MQTEPHPPDFSTLQEHCAGRIPAWFGVPFQQACVAPNRRTRVTATWNGIDARDSARILTTELGYSNCRSTCGYLPFHACQMPEDFVFHSAAASLLPARACACARLAAQLAIWKAAGMS